MGRQSHDSVLGRCLLVLLVLLVLLHRQIGYPFGDRVRAFRPFFFSCCRGVTEKTHDACPGLGLTILQMPEVEGGLRACRGAKAVVGECTAVDGWVEN